MANRKNTDQPSEEVNIEEPINEVINDQEEIVESDASTVGVEKPESDEAGEPDLAEQLALANNRANENWDRMVRMQAEMDNLRKRQSREIENAHKFALEKIATELLGVRDSLEGAIAAGLSEDASVEKLHEGSELTLKQLTQAMEKFNIIEVNPVDEKFNPDAHQAMSMQEVPDTEPNIVIAVLQKGYTLNDRLIRPALVMVSK